MVSTLGFAAPKTSIALRARQGGFLGEGARQEEGVMSGKKAFLSTRPGLDASMRLGVREKEISEWNLTFKIPTYIPHLRYKSVV